MIGDIIDTALDRLRIISQRRLNAALDSLYCLAAQRICALRAELAAERSRANMNKDSYLRAVSEMGAELEQRTRELEQCRAALRRLQSDESRYIHD